MYKVYSWALVLNVKHYFKLHFFVLIEETETEKKKTYQVKYNINVKLLNVKCCLHDSTFLMLWVSL